MNFLLLQIPDESKSSQASSLYLTTDGVYQRLPRIYLSFGVLACTRDTMKMTQLFSMRMRVAQGKPCGKARVKQRQWP